MIRLICLIILLLPVNAIGGSLLMQMGHTVDSGSSSTATVLDVTFEGNSDKNLVDDSEPTTADGSITSTLPYAGTYSYDTGGNANQLIYSVSNFDDDDFIISFAFKMPSYATNDYIMDIIVDASNAIRLKTVGTSINGYYKGGGIETTLEGTTAVNAGAWHTVELTKDGTALALSIDDNSDDSDTAGGTWAGTVSTVYWGIENDDTSGCDCILDNLLIDVN